jgi:hypothetical protein
MKENKTKRGAPKKQLNEKRDKRLGVVQLTENELNSYIESAEIEDKNKSDWVRDTLNAKAKRVLKNKRN